MYIAFLIHLSPQQVTQNSEDIEVLEFPYRTTCIWQLGGITIFFSALQRKENSVEIKTKSLWCIGNVISFEPKHAFALLSS